MSNFLKLMFVIARWSKGIRGSRVLICVAILTSFIAGAGYTLLIALIKGVLADGLLSQAKVIWPFVTFCLAIPICGFTSQMVLLYLTSKAGYELRIQLSRQILASPLRDLETLGPSKLLATVTQDIGSVIELVTILPQML